ncbi:MAG: hypothetical protein ACHRHE_15260, partial [Tepidisphaerales bacterium]
AAVTPPGCAAYVAGARGWGRSVGQTSVIHPQLPGLDTQISAWYADTMRITLYIPDDLKKRMNKLKDVNWSEYACVFFRQRVAEAELSSNRRDSMKSVIERLKASKELCDAQEQSAGWKAGVAWAKSRATAGQLKRLEKARDPSNDWSFGVGDSAYSDAERFCFIIDPDNDGDRANAAQFWEIIGDRVVPDAEFVQAFAEGAMEVWERVQGEL